MPKKKRANLSKEKGGTMSLGKFLSLFLVAAVLLTGCGKKKTEDAEQPLTDLTTSADTATDSSDIFDEFFEEEASTEPEPEPEPAYQTTYTPEFVEDGNYVVQVSCVGSQRLAEENAAKLQDRGWPAYVAEVETPTPELPGTYYRIRIGSFFGISSAKAFGENVLVPEGYDFWVDNKSNDNVGVSAYGMGASSSTSDYGDEYYETSTTEASTTTDSWGSSSTTESSSSSSDWGSSTTTTESSTSTGSDWGSSGSSTTTTESSTSTGSDWGSSSTTTSTTTEPATDASTTGSTTSSSSTGTTESTGSSSGGTGSGGTDSGGSGDDWGSDDWGSDW